MDTASDATWPRRQGRARVSGLLGVFRPGCVDDPFPAPYRFDNMRRELGGVHYGGCLRLPWAHLAYARHRGNLPASLRDAYTEIQNCPNVTGLPLCFEEGLAKELLAWCNSQVPSYELLAIRCAAIERWFGRDCVLDQPVRWLGFDVLAVGEWSMVADGLFTRPDYFAELLPHLNVDGLVATEAAARRLLELYLQGEVEGVVEESTATVPGMEPFIVEVGRVDLAAEPTND